MQLSLIPCSSWGILVCLCVCVCLQDGEEARSLVERRVGTVKIRGLVGTSRIPDQPSAQAQSSLSSCFGNWAQSVSICLLVQRMD